VKASPFYDVTEFLQQVAHASALLPLQLDSPFDDSAACAARGLQFMAQVLEELDILRKSVHDRDDFAATSLLLNP
jgi:hypothetical protein